MEKPEPQPNYPGFLLQIAKAAYYLGGLGYPRPAFC